MNWHYTKQDANIMATALCQNVAMVVTDRGDPPAARRDNVSIISV